jgi:hypothetical protein
VGTDAWWDPVKRQVTCRSCREASEGSEAPPQPEIEADLDPGQPGASIAREYDRRKHNREKRVRRAHPRIGGLLLRLNGEPQHQRAFQIGELGEKAVAESLEKSIAGGPVQTLYNRSMPGGRGDIDILAIAPSGVFVIDAKAVTGKVRIATPWFGKPKLLVNGSNRTKLIDGLDRQVAAVWDAVGADHPDVPIQGVLCFTTADLPLWPTPKMRGHLLLYRKALGKRLNAAGPLSPTAINALAGQLATALPGA